MNGLLYFTADDSVNGRELWQSDGTAAGTLMVQDIYPGSTGSTPEWLTAMNNKLYFAATDPVHGRELWDPPPVFGGTPYIVGPTKMPSTTEPQAEEHIAVDPSDYRNLLAVVIDISTGVPGNRQLINKYAFSSDNGKTWEESFIPIDPVSVLLPTGDGQLWRLTADPVVAIDKEGNAYLANLYIQPGKDRFTGMYVSVTTVDSLKRLGKDTDAGFTAAQTYPVAVNVNPKKNNSVEDKEWIAVDNSDSLYSGNVYLAWAHVSEGGGFDIVFSRSTDHARTWSEPLRIGHSGGNVQAAQTSRQVDSLLATAISWRQASGVDTSALAGIDLRIADLASTTIWLDRNAAGWGWFVNPRLADDTRCFLTGDHSPLGIAPRLGGNEVRSRMNLLRVLTHELPYVREGPDTAGSELIADALFALFDAEQGFSWF